MLLAVVLGERVCVGCSSTVKLMELLHDRDTLLDGEVLMELVGE